MESVKTKRPKLIPVFTMLRAALKVYWANLLKFIRMMLWGLIGLIPAIVIILLAGLEQALWPATNLAIQVIFGVLIALSILWFIYYYARVNLSLYLMIKGGFQKKTRAQFKDSRPFVWPYICLFLLILIFLVPVGILSGSLLVLVNFLPHAPAVVVTLLVLALALLAGIFVMVIFFGLSVFSLVFEKLSALAALRRSISLVQNYWWAVLGRILFISLAIWLFSLVISLPLSFVSENSIFFQIWNLIISVVRALLAPLYLVYMVQVYRTLVKIKA